MKKKDSLLWSGASLVLATALWAASLKPLEAAPDFTLPVYGGKTISLSDYAGKKNVVLVFYRGWVGDWWPNCERQFGEFIDSYPEFKKRNAEILCVSPNDSALVAGYVEAAKKFLKKEFAVPFPILMDAAKRVAEAYGILNKADTAAIEVVASAFIIDRQGRLRLKYVGQEFYDRPPVAYLLEVLDMLSTPGKK